MSPDPIIADYLPEEIDKTAKDKGLIPKGPDPKSGKGSYIDPITGKQRILIHGKHGHVTTPTGERIPFKGEPHIPIDYGE